MIVVELLSGRGAKSLRLVGPLGVEPVDPVQGFDLEVVDIAPWPLAADELGLVGPDRALAQS